MVNISEETRKEEENKLNTETVQLDLFDICPLVINSLSGYINLQSPKKIDPYDSYNMGVLAADIIHLLHIAASKDMDIGAEILKQVKDIKNEYTDAISGNEV